MAGAEIINALRSLSSPRIAIVGDVILDEYVVGSIDRISPEAPIPVLSEKKRYFRLGGAANVALNLKAMGANPILISVVGDDTHGKTVSNLLKDRGIECKLITCNRPTTLKTRYIAQSQQMLRVDHEVTQDITEDESLAVLRELKTLTSLDGVILQDYNKGVLTPQVITESIAYCSAQSISTFVDPKIKNFDCFKGVTVFKPNKKELFRSVAEGDSIEEKLHHIKRDMDITLPITTLASDGIAMLADDAYVHVPTLPIEVIDVSGAGDTTLCAITLAYLAGLSAEQIGIVGNAAGRIVCLKQGVSSLSLEELEAELSHI